MTFINFVSSYKFIFNNAYDKYLTSIYDINDNIQLIEHKFITDNFLILDYDMGKNNLIIRKIPTNPIFSNIFEMDNLNESFVKHFPKLIKNVEKENLIKQLLKNGNNNNMVHLNICN